MWRTTKNIFLRLYNEPISPVPSKIKASVLNAQKQIKASLTYFLYYSQVETGFCGFQGLQESWTMWKY